MIVGLDAGFDPSWQAGLLYVRNLVYTLSTLPPQERPRVRLLPVTAETVRRVQDLMDLDFIEIADASETSLRVRRVKRKFLQPFVGRPLDRAFRDVDVTFPGFGRPIPGVPQIHWIPDFQHVHLPHLFDEEELSRRDRRFAELASTPGTLILSSEAAKDDFVHLYPDARAKPTVWRFCSQMTRQEDGGKDPFTAFGLPEKYLYVANQFWVHKDHLTLFEALHELRSRRLAPVVVCTGSMEDGRDPTYIDQIKRFLRDRSLTDQVRVLGMLSRPDQVAVLRHAAAVVQPSRFEGWSTVVEDAKVVGRPVILSDIKVHREQMPEAHFFSVGSVSSLADALANFLPQAVPGPDPEAEAQARVATHTRALEAARNFVSILRSAIEDHRALRVS